MWLGEDASRKRLLLEASCAFGTQIQESGLPVTQAKPLGLSSKPPVGCEIYWSFVPLTLTITRDFHNARDLETHPDSSVRLTDFEIGLAIYRGQHRAGKIAHVLDHVLGSNPVGGSFGDTSHDC